MGLFDGIRFPYLSMQQINLDWILEKIKELMGFMPEDGNVGDILMRKSDGASWETPSAVQVDINGLPEDLQIMDNDQLVFYDISQQANRKIKPPNLLDSMCSNGYPLMNGTADAGTSKKPSRYDHVHPTDTSRQAALSGAQMNAVNSGAPANSFSSGKLKVDNGGTGVDNLPDLKQALGIHELYADHFDVQSGVTQDMVAESLTGGYIFVTGASSYSRAVYAYGVTSAGVVSYTALHDSADLVITTDTNKISITNNLSSTIRVLQLW